MSVRIDTPQNLALVPLPIGPAGGAGSTSTTTQPSVTQQPLKISPFDMSRYAAPQPVQLPNGTSIQLPSLSANEQQQVSSLFGGFSSTQMTSITSASQNLSNAIYNVVAAHRQAAQTQAAQNSAADNSDDDDDDDDDDAGLTAATPQYGMPAQPTALPVTALPTGEGANTTSSQTANAALESRNPVVLNTSKLATQTPASSTVTQSSGTLQSGTSGLSSSSSEAPTASIASPAVTQAVTNAATAYSSANAQSGSSSSYDTTVQSVTYMGVIGLQSDLQNYAEYVQGQLNNQNTVRGELSTVTQALTDWPANAQTQNFTYTTYDAYGNPTTQTQSLTKDEASALQQNLQASLDSMGDQNQLDQLHLQDMSQNYQQGITTLSNILKMNYDTIKSVIGNVKSS